MVTRFVTYELNTLDPDCSLCLRVGWGNIGDAEMCRTCHTTIQLAEGFLETTLKMRRVHVNQYLQYSEEGAERVVKYLGDAFGSKGLEFSVKTGRRAGDNQYIIMRKAPSYVIKSANKV